MEFDAEALDSIPEQDLLDIYNSIVDGAQTPAASLGFDDAALNSIERMAVGYYRARHLDKAAAIYGFLLRMDSKRSSTWRGLGACAQALQQYEAGAAMFRQAVECAPNDVITQVFLGECLCQLGEREEGLQILNTVVERGADSQAAAAYVTRARAIIGAEGGVPARVILKREGRRLSKSMDAYAEEMGVEAPQVFDPTEELDWEHMKKDPKLMESIGHLKKAYEEGNLTLAEIGGFTENELNGAYACACKYADMGQVMQALQITGYLIFIDSYQARYYQLAGICMQRVGDFDSAERFYGLAVTLDKKDPMTAIYRGESKIMSGNVDEGVQWVRDGLELASADAPKHQDLIERANILIKQFST